jgi:hypothetical protein
MFDSQTVTRRICPSARLWACPSNFASEFLLSLMFDFQTVIKQACLQACPREWPLIFASKSLSNVSWVFNFQTLHRPKEAKYRSHATDMSVGMSVQWIPRIMLTFQSWTQLVNKYVLFFQNVHFVDNTLFGGFGHYFKLSPCSQQASAWQTACVRYSCKLHTYLPLTFYSRRGSNHETPPKRTQFTKMTWYEKYCQFTTCDRW